MKKIVIIIIGILTVQLLLAQATYQITNFSMGGLLSAEFTTNNFKCIAVGKGNRVWAGTQYGGLYTFDPPFDVNNWRKSTRLDSLSLNDIKIDGDSAIWIAQSGKQQTQSGNSNIAGGLNYFPVASDLSMQFYSVLGTTSAGALVSRNARSLYLDKSYKLANGSLPRPWLAQGTFISAFNTKRGGLNIGLLANSPYLLNYATGYATGNAATPISEAIGGNKDEVWVAARLNNGGSQILRYKPGAEYIGIHGTADTSLFQPGFAAQAIHFDNAGNRWIGLKSGGLIIKTATSWLKLDVQSLIPPGTQINFNAITSDEFENVYIGTSNGMLQYLSKKYHPSSNPDYPPSYTLFTTNDGLIDNNITGITYDKKYGRLLITSSGGVSFITIRQRYIKGVALDVTCKIDNNNPYPGLQTSPLTGGLLTAKLFKNGIEDDFVYPGIDGVFEFKNANDIDTYSVEISWRKNGKTIKYVYENVYNHTQMQPTLIPDGLLVEMKKFKDSMARRCFPLKLTLGIEVPVDIFCANGFNVANYDTPGEEFYAIAGVRTNHKKRVDNLANYYMAMKTVYKLGGDATDLYADMIANAIDAVQSLQAFLEMGDEVKKIAALDPTNKLGKAGIEKKAMVSKLTNELKFLKAQIVHILSKVSNDVTDPETKKNIDRCTAFVNDAADIAISFMQDDKVEFGTAILVDVLKKVVSTLAVRKYYEAGYAGDLHQYFVATARLSAMLNQSDLTYEEAYEKLYSGTFNSVGKQSTDILSDRKGIIENAARVSKYAETSGKVFDAARTLALIIPGAQELAPVFQFISVALKAVNTFSFGVATYFAAVGNTEIEKLSKKILAEADLQRPFGRHNIHRSAAISQNQPTALIAFKNDYNLKLGQLQTVYNMPIFDSASYHDRYVAFTKADSLYGDELNRTMNKLEASTDSATRYIPSFKVKLDKVMDSFITRQYTLRHALFYRNLAYIYDSVKTNQAAGLDSLTKEIKRLNDSAINGIVYLINDINNNGIAAPAYLVQDSVSINHTHVPGSAGSLQFYFTNYGAQAQNNVSFKMKEVTTGYTITSADSINVGTILPGVTKQVSFSFLSPITDSLGRYQIEVKATNGVYKDVYGTLLVIDPAKFFTVKDGNWNNPTTWHKNLVPASTNSVHINHVVTVTTDTSCKSVTVNKPGKVIVNAGKRIIVSQ